MPDTNLPRTDRFPIPNSISLRSASRRLEALELCDALARHLAGGAREPEEVRAAALRAVRAALGCQGAAMWLAGEEGPGAGCLQDLLCVPLRSGEGMLGSLGAWSSDHEQGFDEEDERALVSIAQVVALAVENARFRRAFQKRRRDTALVLADAVDKKDRCTGGHLRRVAAFAMAIAHELSGALGSEQLEQLRLAAILHDLGKIGVEDRILRKPAALESQEWAMMQEHPELGSEIVSRIDGFEEAAAGLRFHHERWDGRGYPQGLRGEEIPLIARIIAVADAYDAMTSSRPYREAVLPEQARAEIQKHSGRQFDPRVVEAFLRAFEQRALELSKEPVAQGWSELYD